MAVAGMAVTYAGANADLNDPIGYALRKLGYTVASITAVADTDLDDVATDDHDKLLDVAELRTLETILGNLDDVDLRVGPRDEAFNQLADRLEKAIERKRTYLVREYGFGAELEEGLITLAFQEQNDSDDTE
jgi:hypothetical protein